MALAALTTLPLRWRVAPDEPAAKWRSDSTAWAGQTVADMRRALAPTCNSTATLAAAYAPELWLCGADGTFSQPEPPVAPAKLLKWTNTTYHDSRLGEEHDDGSPKAFVLFTFPPTAAAASRTFAREVFLMARVSDLASYFHVRILFPLSAARRNQEPRRARLPAAGPAGAVRERAVHQPPA